MYLMAADKSHLRKNSEKASVAAIVAAFFGAQAMTNKKKQDKQLNGRRYYNQ